MYGTEDLDVRSKMDNVARCIQTLPTVGQLSQLHNHPIASPPRLGFKLLCNVTRVSGMEAAA